MTPARATRKFNPLVLLLVPLLGVVGAVLTIVANGGLNSTPPTPAPVTLASSRLVGRAAPNFELPTLESALANSDGTLRLSSLRGRLVFVNFWATWCEPCVRELPAFEQFVAEQGEDGAAILAVNIGEEVQVIQAFLAENGIEGIPVLLDSTYRAQTAYEAALFPSTFVIDPSGILRELHLGEMTLDDLNGYVEQFGSAGL
jgi:thiol-disulfide isomerase/thioredoxin